MERKVLYFKDNDIYYKVNIDIKRITKVYNNTVEYLDYEINYTNIQSLKKIKMNEWKHIENSFFISQHFQWNYQGSVYRTTDKQIVFKDNKHGTRVADIFHNGKIWEIYYSSNYYPRVYLSRVQPNGEKTNKWTDIKYCRHFEKVPRIEKIKNLLVEL